MGSAEAYANTNGSFLLNVDSTSDIIPIDVVVSKGHLIYFVYAVAVDGKACFHIKICARSDPEAQSNT